MSGSQTPQVTIANLANAYKELFPQIRLNQLAEMDRDLFKWLPKKDDLVGGKSSGGYYHVPVKYGMPQSIARQFGTAQTNSGVSGTGAGKVTRFELARNAYYGVLALDDESIRAARDRNGAFYDIKEAEIEDMVKQISMELEKHLWRDGKGVSGVISAITTATPAVITLTNADDVANFHVGMLVGANDADTAATATDRDGAEAVTALDLDAGTITMTSDLVTDHSWAVGDFLFRNDADGEAGEGDGGSNLVIGLAGWIPETAESSGTFKGSSDRPDDVQRLQGFRQSYLGSIEETLKKCAAKMRRLGGNYDTIWLSHTNWHRLEQELGSRAIRDDGSGSPFGIPSIKYASPDGVKSVMAGAFCPDDVGYLMKRDCWTLHHMDPVPHIVTTDGLRMARLSSADGVEVRVRMWVDLACREPKNNGVISIS